MYFCILIVFSLFCWINIICIKVFANTASPNSKQTQSSSEWLDFKNIIFHYLIGKCFSFSSFNHDFCTHESGKNIWKRSVVGKNAMHHLVRDLGISFLTVQIHIERGHCWISHSIWLILLNHCIEKWAMDSQNGLKIAKFKSRKKKLWSMQPRNPEIKFSWMWTKATWNDVLQKFFIYIQWFF